MQDRPEGSRRRRGHRWGAQTDCVFEEEVAIVDVVGHQAMRDRWSAEKQGKKEPAQRNCGPRSERRDLLSPDVSRKTSLESAGTKGSLGSSSTRQRWASDRCTVNLLLGPILCGWVHRHREEESPEDRQKSLPKSFARRVVFDEIRDAVLAKRTFSKALPALLIQRFVSRIALPKLDRVSLESLHNSY